MKLKAVSGMMLTLLLIGMLTLAFTIQPVKASDTIYIRSDGSIDPPTANITTVDNVTYTFIGNVNESIVVERDNIVVDGVGHTLQGAGWTSGQGITLSSRSNVTIKNVKVKAFNYGIHLVGASNNRISGNNLTNNIYGILLNGSSNNTVFGNTPENNSCGIGIGPIDFIIYSFNNRVTRNTVKNNDFGILLTDSDFNNISENTVKNNLYFGIEIAGGSSNNNIYRNNMTNSQGNGIRVCGYSNNNNIYGNSVKNNKRGIDLSYSYNNKICRNSFVNNTLQARILPSGYANLWDEGYPSGGNYWSDHVCTGNPSDGSQPYIIDADNIDHYPFQDPNGWLLHQLTVASSPIIGVAFTINGNPQTTPYAEWLLEGSYTLIMPKTHNGYVWSHWREDGDTNRIKTILLQGTTWTAVYTPAPPVGGKAIPINKATIKSPPQTLWVWLTAIMFSMVATVVFVKHKKKRKIKLTL